MRKERMEINKNNYYVKHAHEIKAICENDKCDIGVAVIKFDQLHDGGDIDSAKEFLHLVNESIRKDDPEGMTLSKLCEVV